MSAQNQRSTVSVRVRLVRALLLLGGTLLSAAIITGAILHREAANEHRSYLQTLEVYLNRVGISFSTPFLTLNAHYPRVLPAILDTAKIEGLLRTEFGIDLSQQCKKPGLYWSTTCLAHDASAALTLGEVYDTLAQFTVSSPSLDDRASTAWQLALLYDQVAKYRHDHPVQDQVIRQKLRTALHEHLQLLDTDGASLWHGRFTLACHAWLLAVVIAEDDALLLQRAHRHFMNSAQALALTEAWPEGYNYWINNRALPFALASAAYIYGTTDEAGATYLKHILARNIRWHIYMTRPDHRIDPIGDEGPRVDLKDETRPYIDLATRLTNDPVGATYSSYLYNLHKADSYYSGYRWLAPLIRSWVRPLADPGKSLALFEGVLPLHEVFGADAYNQIVILEGWGPDDAQLRIRAGDQFTHHQHYDAGHFTLFKSKPIMVDASTYSSMFTDNRLFKGVQTLSKNSLLVMQPGADYQPNHLFARNINSGGQRLSMPTGSALTSVAHWQQQLRGRAYLKRANLLRAWHSSNAHLVEIDMTDAYPNQRNRSGSQVSVSSIQRLYFYHAGLGKLLIKDAVRVAGDAEGLATKQVFHVQHLPQVTDMAGQWVAGTPGNGLWLNEAAQRSALPVAGAMLYPLIPDPSRLKLVGGERYKHWVEMLDSAQARQAIFVDDGYVAKPWFDDPSWRLELESESGGSGRNHLTLIDLAHPTQPPTLVRSPAGLVLDLTGMVVAFVESTESGSTTDLPTVSVNTAPARDVFVIARAAIKQVNVHVNGRTQVLNLNQGVGVISAQPNSK